MDFVSRNLPASGWRGMGMDWQANKSRTSCRGQLSLALLAVCWLLATGCAAIPDISHKAQIHNPFPQLHRIAVVPFFNQSKEPTVDGDSIAIAYYNELQTIPGFEVMPVGVARQVIAGTQIQLRSGQDFQKLAQLLGVDAVVVGSVTEYHPYYPPRMGLTVDWYAANPGFHPIPVGYGLPWGTAEEEYIPEQLKQAAEFELARAQLATQTPEVPIELETPAASSSDSRAHRAWKVRQAEHTNATNELEPEVLPPMAPEHVRSLKDVIAESAPSSPTGLPADWPDPRGFVPAAPRAIKPLPIPQAKPVITHTKLYNGKDSEFTEKLGRYFYQQDDARFGGWQAYLQRPDDFVRFCCHLHVTETLAARGGAGRTQVIVRWPISR